MGLYHFAELFAGLPLLVLKKDIAHNAYFSRLPKIASTLPRLSLTLMLSNITPPTFQRFHFCARVTFAEVAHKMWNPFPLASSSPSPPSSLKPLKKFILSAVSPHANSIPHFPFLNFPYYFGQVFSC